MVPSAQSDAVLRLGKRLTQELDLSQSVDTLSRWLAHTVAEKMAAIDVAAPEQRSGLQSEVIDLILKLWARRRDFPKGKRPFEEIESLAGVLMQLHPEGKAPRYFSSATPQDMESAPPAARIWLQRAMSIDNAARSTIRYCLLAADDCTLGDATMWADLADAAGLGDSIEVKIVRILGHLPEEQQAKFADVLTRAQEDVRRSVTQFKEAVAAIEAESFGGVPVAKQGPRSD